MHYLITHTEDNLLTVTPGDRVMRRHVIIEQPFNTHDEAQSIVDSLNPMLSQLRSSRHRMLRVLRHMSEDMPASQIAKTLGACGL